MAPQSGVCIQSIEQTKRLVADILIRALEDVPDPRHKHYVVGEMVRDEVSEFIVASEQVARDCSDATSPYVFGSKRKRGWCSSCCCRSRGYIMLCRNEYVSM